MIADITDPWFGAIPDDPTKYVENQTAIMTALATGVPVTAPAGKIFHTQPINAPSQAKEMFGKFGLRMAGAAQPTDLGLIYGSGHSKLTLRGIDVIVPMEEPYLTFEAIHFEGVSKLRIIDVDAQGYFGIRVIGSANVRVRDCDIPDFGVIGVRAEECSDVKITGCSAQSAQPASWHCYQIQGAAQASVIGNQAANSGYFGVSITGSYPPSPGYAQGHSHVVNDNRISNTGREAINFDHVDQLEAVGNHINGTVDDFAISTYNNPVLNPTGAQRYGLIASNYIYSPAKLAIALGNGSHGIFVVGNAIINPNASQGVTPYHRRGAILMFGGGCTHNHIGTNMIFDPNGNVDYQVAEYTDATPELAGTPDYNLIGRQMSRAGAITAISPLAQNSEYLGV